MSRTTLDIDRTILEEIRRLHRKERRSMGSIATELLAEAISRRKNSRVCDELAWVSRPMRALIDLNDKEALYEALEKDER